ncbi:FMN-binding negative transcriptional regulator [Pontimicrobium aquaticum]|uniref:FMN-binding negative transcriptional regulator n=1 Tax=Pontimicrobium aquaticum TaxID=2565367 RepID=A0A4U0F0C3_9FLAO|nr:FMN-binding negative transcriptional regulator [Pontimicrobium aquaticum]TJY37793.1 FMN-binding negative transcriptional regulator [Pontimicrobium aquaticum]
MYIPKKNLQTNKKQIVEFIQRFSFGTIITSKRNLPIATHLPFVVSEDQGDIILTSHFAKANNQWRDIDKNVLVIFSEPHAYISPKNYEKELNVPTWNYISVHAYGKGKIITDLEKTFELLEHSIENFEVAYKQQWNKLPLDFKTKMANGIVAFEINVSEIQAKEKLSQNKTKKEQKNIIDSLSNSGTYNEKLIADYMRKSL